MIGTPIVFYPFAKALWLAGDLVFRPPTAADFEPGRADDDQRSSTPLRSSTTPSQSS